MKNDKKNLENRKENIENNKWYDTFKRWVWLSNGNYWYTKLFKRSNSIKNKNGVTNKTKFTENKFDDIIDFKNENILSFFKSINFILSEDSKKRLNLLFFI